MPNNEREEEGREENRSRQKDEIPVEKGEVWNPDKQTDYESDNGFAYRGPWPWRFKGHDGTGFCLATNYQLSCELGRNPHTTSMLDKGKPWACCLRYEGEVDN